MLVDIVSQQNIQLELTGQTGGVSSVEIQPGGLTSGPSVTVEVSQLSNPSFTIDGVATNIEISNDVIVGGADPALANRVTALENILSALNRLPIAVSDSVTGSDSVNSVTAYLLSNDTDFEGSNSLSIMNWTYNSVTRLPGQTATGLYGSISVASNGNATYVIDSRGRALNSGVTVTETITYTVVDKNNSTVSSSVTFTITGSNNAPVVVADSAIVLKNKTISGNVLVNDSDPEGVSLVVSSIEIEGSTYITPASVNLAGVGVINMQPNGDWTASPATDYTGEIPLVYYNTTDGNSSSQGVLSLAIALGPVPSESNPVTSSRSSSIVYDVYSDADLDAIPWSTLSGGTTINIHHKATPYKRKFALRGSGTYTNPITIWGVTDSNGNRPVLDFNESTTCPLVNQGGSNNIFSGTLEYGESLGGIVIKRGLSDPVTYKPSHIKIANLELKGTTHGNTYTTLTGSQATYAVAAGVYIMASRHVTIENCIITENGNGVFTMAKEETLDQAAEYVTLRNNRIFGNGVVGSYYEHNVYMQAWQPLIEGNYFGQVRAGSLGSTYKSRSGKEIIRFNTFLGSARILDLVHSEDQNIDGIMTQPEYGTDFVYGNILINDSALPLGNTYAGVHFGGDNLGEDENSLNTGLDSKYRKQLYFFNNVYYVRFTSGYRTCLFDISLKNIKLDLWNNSFIANVPVGFQVSWTEWAGTINLRGNNNIYSTVAFQTARNDASSLLYVYNSLGTITYTDPKPNDLTTYDFTPCNGSSLIGQSTSAPTGTPSSLNDYELVVQPRIGTNGMLARTTTTDVGPLMSISQEQVTPTGFTSAGEGSGGGGGGGGASGSIVPTNGVFLFNENNGTTFSNNTDFVGNGASSKSRYEVQDGAVKCVAGAGTYGETLFYSGTANTSQASVAEMEYPWVGTVTLAIRASPTQSGYSISVNPSSWTFGRAGVWQGSSSTPVGSGGSQTIKIYEEGGFVKCFVDGTQIVNFAESTPLTGGFPSFGFNTPTESSTRMLSWKDFN